MSHRPVKRLIKAKPALEGAGIRLRRALGFGSTSDFDAAGEIIDLQLAERFVNNVAAFMSLVEAAKHYPCIKKARVEFLGEQPDPATDRVE